MLRESNSEITKQYQAPSYLRTIAECNRELFLLSLALPLTVNIYTIFFCCNIYFKTEHKNAS